jgi:hypothetical protein
MTRQNQVVNNRSPSTSQSAGDQDNSTSEINTYCSFEGKTRNHILLATALSKLETNLVNMYLAGHY